MRCVDVLCAVRCAVLRCAANAMRAAYAMLCYALHYYVYTAR